MTLILIAVAGIALTVIGLMPGDTYDRGWPVVVVLIVFAVWWLVDFLKSVRERSANTKQSDREGFEWNSPQTRRQDLRRRSNARARRRSGSRVLGVGSGVGPGRPKIRNSSERRQSELRVEQGRRDAARIGATDRLQRKRQSSVAEPDPINKDREAILKLDAGPGGASRRVSQSAERRQRELRIKQGMQYAREANFSAKGGSESISERKKRTRLRRRQARFWRENKSFWM